MDFANALVEESAALLAVNQRRRSHAEATLALVAVLSLVVSATAIALRDAAVFLPLPVIALLLTSLSFQQYADVSVIGAARRRMERSVNQLGEQAVLVYESEVAGIRKQAPLVLSVRVLQTLIWAGLVGAIGAGAFIAAEQPTWALAVYLGVTAVAAISATLSFIAMRRADHTAERALGDI
ncbi:MAG TPA: hypothetical protein VN618_15840 [Solirubrobacteraceae bacterium]|nr:hypothetical protein [Solirubrobacteraceae bacterium]